jgi:threonine dehydrogenase-like Zn-dependent dehydrogenase
MLVACGGAVTCGRCRACLSGRGNLCARYTIVGFHWDGALARYCTAPAASCVAVDQFGLGADAAALVQPMAIATHAARRGAVEVGDEALIIGAGGIGIVLTYQVAQAAGHLTVVDVSPERLDTARRLGAQETLAPTEAPVAESLGRSPAVIFEASGTATGLATALEVAGAGSRVVVIGVQPKPEAIDWREVTFKEIEMVGSQAMVPALDLRAAARSLAGRSEGWGDIAPLVLPLADFVEKGLEPMVRREPERMKTLIDPWIDAPRPSTFA